MSELLRTCGHESRNPHTLVFNHCTKTPATQERLAR